MNRALAFAFTGSFAAHGMMAGSYFYFQQHQALKPMTVITDVDLLEMPEVPRQAVPEQKGTWDFLKLALPAIPQALETKPVQENLVDLDQQKETKKQFGPIDKLEEESGRLASKVGLEKPEAGPREALLADVLARQAPASRSLAPAEALLPVEEVGLKRAPPPASGLSWEEQERLVSRQKTIQEINLSVAARSGRAPAVLEAPGALLEAPPVEALKPPVVQQSILEEKQEPARGLPALEEKLSLGLPLSQIPLLKKQAEDLQEPKKKAVEIEGPLSGRKVLSMSVPPYPEWARRLQITEMDVAIRFYVSSEGKVLPEMRVERTSGYGVLDKLAMEHLRKWIFAPLEPKDGERQWGVITFRFILE